MASNTSNETFLIFPGARHPPHDQHATSAAREPDTERDAVQVLTSVAATILEAVATYIDLQLCLPPYVTKRTGVTVEQAKCNLGIREV